MKKILFVIMLIVFFIPANVFALNEVNLYLFWGDGCPYCERELQYLEKLQDKYDNLKIYKYETWKNPTNKEHLKKVKEFLNANVSGVPFTVIGDSYILGFSSSKEAKFEELIKKYSETDYDDKVGKYFNITHETNIDGTLPIEETDSKEVENPLESPSVIVNKEEKEANLEENSLSLSNDKVVIILAISVLIVALVGIYFLSGKRK